MPTYGTNLRVIWRYVVNRALASPNLDKQVRIGNRANANEAPLKTFRIVDSQPCETLLRLAVYDSYDFQVHLDEQPRQNQSIR